MAAAAGCSSPNSSRSRARETTNKAKLIHHDQTVLSTTHSLGTTVSSCIQHNHPLASSAKTGTPHSFGQPAQQPARHSFNRHSLQPPASMADLRMKLLLIVALFIIVMSLTSFLALRYLSCFRDRRRPQTPDKLDLEKQSMESDRSSRPPSPLPALHLTPPEGCAMLLTLSDRGSGPAFMRPIEAPPLKQA
ncbi:hypothetical protein BCR37DRAFT_237247 [Protomyces lactucae-debilis]|uniref:Uncharacterized protein n=1 Tax=Protomyces lactucae-debilis TaxID=2754530 RepID=A0A1Y2FN66_PROLT|nr:uncharacterized protein BCR37DRAFT_237247 [Protomyces lactucae-debilis]ORY85432.1 hypothetical protein BCR37DRAFT_237247 [Protomyces lactucae-debilis]